MSDCDYTALQHGDTALVWLVGQERLEPQTGMFISIGDTEKWSIGGRAHPLGQVSRFIPMRRALAANDLLAACEAWMNMTTRVVAAGGAESPLPQDVIESFARTQQEVMSRTAAAIAKARGEVQP